MQQFKCAALVRRRNSRGTTKFANRIAIHSSRHCVTDRYWPNLKAVPHMSMQHTLLVPLLGCLLLGCNGSRPAPPPAELNKAVEEAVSRGFDEIGKQLDATDKDLKQKAVSFLIEGVRDNEHERELFSQVQRLEDAGTKSNSVSSGGGYYQKDIYFRISPISDMEAAAARIDFGLVLAVDPTDRVVLVDASAKLAPRPAQGWPGAKAIDDYVVRKTATWAVTQVGADLVKKFGTENVVVVHMPEEPRETPGVSLSPDKHPLVAKLRTLAPETLASNFPGFGPKGKNFVTATVAPIQKLDDVVKALDGAEILAVDEQRRVILIGNLADLKPPRAEVKELAPAK